MEISYLKEFIKLAETENYLEASDQLFMSQSSLSKHIQTLEKEAKAPFFIRTTRKVKLSEAGKAFLPFAKAICSSFDQGLLKINEIQDTNSKTISIGVIPSIDSYGITEILNSFSSSKERYLMKAYEEDSSKLVESLKSGACSLAFIYKSALGGDPSIATVPFASDSLVAVVPKANPISKKKSVTMEELSRQKCVLLESHTVLKNTVFSEFKKRGLEPNVGFTQRHFLSAFELHDSDSIAFFFKRDASYVNNPGNTIVDIVPDIKVDLVLAYCKDQSLSDSAQAFIDLIKGKLLER